MSNYVFYFINILIRVTSLSRNFENLYDLVFIDSQLMSKLMNSKFAVSPFHSSVIKKQILK